MIDRLIDRLIELFSQSVSSGSQINFYLLSYSIIQLLYFLLSQSISASEWAQISLIY